MAIGDITDIGGGFFTVEGAAGTFRTAEATRVSTNLAAAEAATESFLGITDDEGSTARVPDGSEYEWLVGVTGGTPTAIDPDKLLTEMDNDGMDVRLYSIGPPTTGTLAGKEKRLRSLFNRTNPGTRITGTFRVWGGGALTDCTRITMRGDQGVDMFWSVSASRWVVREIFWDGVDSAPLFETP
jgi:hypothetical protein